jgi:pimeloyl-ACP methyl ester carboxylesterase
VSLPGRFVSTSVGRVFVHRAGAPRPGATPLVLVHGFMLSHHSFQPVVRALAAEREVIAVDLPGFGESDRPPPSSYGYDAAAFADTVTEVLERLDVGRVALLGHSMGGGVALRLAARWPERVERLVLVAAAAYPLPMSVEARILLSPTVGGFLWKNVVSRADLRRSMRRDDVRDPELVTDEYVDYWYARFCRAGAREASYAALQHISRLSNHSEEPGAVRAPTLIVWGEEDRRVPLAHGKRLQRAIAGARLEVLPACGHTPQLEQSDELVRLVREFLDEPLQAAPPRAVAAGAAEPGGRDAGA